MSRARESSPTLLVGRRIRALRQERRLSQTELARQIGIQQSDLSRMEKGEYRVPLHVLFGILQAFGLTFEGFFGEGESASLTVQEHSLLHSFRELTPDGQREVVEYVEFKRARERRGEE